MTIGKIEVDNSVENTLVDKNDSCPTDESVIERSDGETYQFFLIIAENKPNSKNTRKTIN